MHKLSRKNREKQLSAGEYLFALCRITQAPHPPHKGRLVWRGEKCRAGYQYVYTGGNGGGGGLFAYAAVNREQKVKAPLLPLFRQKADFFQTFGDNRLAAKTGDYRHDQNQIGVG